MQTKTLRGLLQPQRAMLMEDYQVNAIRKALRARRKRQRANRKAGRANR